MDQTGSGYSDSTESHMRLEALLAQWQHLDGFINSTEARYNTILMVLVTLLTAGNFYVASNEAPLESRGFVSCAFILVACTVLSYLEHEFRRVAALRGLLQQLERKFNKIIGQNNFAWNSTFVPAYIGKSWTNWTLSISLGITLLAVLAWTYYTAYLAFGINVVTLALLALLAFVLISVVVMLYGNQAVINAVARGETEHGTLLDGIHGIAQGVIRTIKDFSESGRRS